MDEMNEKTEYTETEANPSNVEIGLDKDVEVIQCGSMGLANETMSNKMRGDIGNRDKGDPISRDASEHKKTFRTRASEQC